MERVRSAVDTVREQPLWAKRIAIGVGIFVLWLILDNTLKRNLPPGVIVLGLVFGSLYALTAVGLVLIFRANRVVNFAQAELGGVAAVIAIQLVLQFRWNYFVSVFLGLFGSAALGGLIFVFIIRRFRRAPRLILAVATIGIAQILAGASVIISLLFEGQPAGRRFVTPFDIHLSLFPVLFRGDHLLVLFSVPVVLLALTLFLRYTDYGIAIRAAAENGERANLLGIPILNLHVVVWAIAGFLSAAAALLRVPVVGFSSFTSVTGSGNALLLFTLAAAVLGRMESLPRTVLAALALGVIQQTATWAWSNTNIADVLLVVIILVALLAQRGYFTRAAETGISTWKAIREVRPIPAELRSLPEVQAGTWIMRGLLLAFALTVPVWANAGQENVAGLTLIYGIVAISLVILTGWAGHISLGQFAFVGFGAAATAVLYGRHNWDFFAAMVVGVAVAAVVALIIGLPALRIRGPFLAVTTLAFAVTAGSYFLEDRYFPWFIQGSIKAPRLWDRVPLNFEWQIYYLCLVALLIALVAARNLRRSRTGRALIAVRDNELAAESFSIDSVRLKLLAFVISGALAGFAGAVYAVHQGGIFTGSFNSQVSVRLFSMVVIGGLGSIPGAVLGAIYVQGAEFFLSGGYALLASGGGLLVLLMFFPEGLGGLMYAVRDALLRRIAARRGIVVPSLVADVRQQQQEVEVELGDVLVGAKR